jgi:tRNA(Ile2) C34 agmatinyltransferase TiaS
MPNENETLDCPVCGGDMHYAAGKNTNRCKFNCDGSASHPHRVTVYIQDSMRNYAKPAPAVSGIRALVERAKRLTERGDKNSGE